MFVQSKSRSRAFSLNFCLWHCLPWTITFTLKQHHQDRDIYSLSAADNPFVPFIIMYCGISLSRSPTPHLKIACLFKSKNSADQIFQTKPKHLTAHYLCLSLSLLAPYCICRWNPTLNSVQEYVGPINWKDTVRGRTFSHQPSSLWSGLSDTVGEWVQIQYLFMKHSLLST